MYVARVLSLSLVVVLSAGWAKAQDWPHRTTAREPSAWEKFDSGTKKFFAETADGTKRLFVQTGEGTKKFFAGTKDALTWKKPAEKKKTSRTPWGYTPPKKQKQSWLGSLFRRKEPEPSKSLADFMSAGRLDP